MKDIRSLSFDELKSEIIENLSLPSYRADQIYNWLHKSIVSSFDEMLNLPKEVRKSLSDGYEIYGCKIEKKLISKIDGTVKYLFKLYDGNFIESVVMKYKYGYTICISTQVGCRMGCSFCASTIGGLQRNLLPSEMLGQIYTATKDLDIRISHIVLMGMGEPLDNYENVIKFIRLVSDDKGLNISARNISLSTCGLVEKIYSLIDEKIPLTLSISLHAPNNEIRSQIMPISKKYKIEDLLTACRKYAEVTSRRISFEYSMIDGVNDSDDCAIELSKRLKGMLCHVNLIPVNKVSEKKYCAPKKDRIESFLNILNRYGITATVRRTLGSDINASCGQLRQSQGEKRGEQS